MFSPYVFPVTASTFNFASPVFVAVTIIGVIMWWITPEENWLSREFVDLARKGIQVGSDDDLTGEKGEGSAEAEAEVEATTPAESVARA